MDFNCVRASLFHDGLNDAVFQRIKIQRHKIYGETQKTNYYIQYILYVLYATIALCQEEIKYIVTEQYAMAHPPSQE